MALNVGAAPMGMDEIQALRVRHPEMFGASPARRALRALFWLVLAVLVILGLWHIDASPARIWDGLSRLGILTSLMIPPTSGGALPDILYGLMETLAMAFFGTVVATLIAVPIGFLGARNVIPARIFRFSLRRGLDFLRGVDVLIFAIVFVSAVGMGPFAGILAIIVNDVGNFSKLFAEAIENTDRKSIDGVTASGANRLEIIRLGMLPQVAPVMISHVLFFFEHNVRAASILGIVGAGGIGFHLSERMRGNAWDEASFIIIILLITVACVDWLSRRIRLKIIGP